MCCSHHHQDQCFIGHGDDFKISVIVSVYGQIVLFHLLVTMLYSQKRRNTFFIQWKTSNLAIPSSKLKNRWQRKSLTQGRGHKSKWTSQEQLMETPLHSVFTMRCPSEGILKEETERGWCCKSILNPNHFNKQYHTHTCAFVLGSNLAEGTKLKFSTTARLQV